MIINKIDKYYNNTNFGMNYKPSNKILENIARTTRLSISEMYNLPMDKAVQTMKERGSIRKEPNKLKLLIAKQLRKFEEKFGLIKREINTYTDID